LGGVEQHGTDSLSSRRLRPSVDNAVAGSVATGRSDRLDPVEL
jgi:hypothetical protein